MSFVDFTYFPVFVTEGADIFFLILEEPVGKPYREVCLSFWKEIWQMKWNRIDRRTVLLNELKMFFEIRYTETLKG